MTPEQEQRIWSMCYREVSDLKRKLEACSDGPFEDSDFFEEVLNEKQNKVSQGGHIKNSGERNEKL